LNKDNRKNKDRRKTKMKKTTILTTAISLCMAASMLAGCSQGSSGGETAVATRIEGGQTQISVEASEAASVSSEDKYKFTYKGYEIAPGSNAAAALEAFGDDYDRVEVASCAYQGVDIVYTYPGFTLYAFSDSGVEYINVIEVTDSLIDCGGISVGDSIQKAKDIYGTPDVGDDYGVLYRSGKTELQISTDGVDTIIAIVYKRVAE
jgi:hypothetical protein